MRVLMFGWEFPPHISGGLGTACFGLTRSLVDQNVHITFVLPKVKHGAGGSHVDLIGASDIGPSLNDIDKMLPQDLMQFIPFDSLLSPYRTSEQYLLAVKEIREEFERKQASGEMNLMSLSGDYADNLKEEVGRFAFVGKKLGGKIDFDVIHAHDWMTYLAGVEAKRISNKPLVVHVHATEFDRSGPNPNNDVYDIERYGMEQADRVIAVSHRTKHMIVEKYGIDSNKVTVVHNAVDKNSFVDPKQIYKIPGEQVVLFLGRITQQKGPEFFVDAAKLVYDRMPHVRFIMAGNGDLLPRMIEKVAFYRMQDRFHFTGFLRGTDIEKIYSLSDVYVMPSVSEPFGITPLEAIRHGVPCIVSKQTGAAEILKDVIKVDFWDVHKLTDSIMNVLQRPELAHSLIRNSKKCLAHISWAQAAQKVRQVYQSVSA